VAKEGVYNGEEDCFFSKKVLEFRDNKFFDFLLIYHPLPIIRFDSINGISPSSNDSREMAKSRVFIAHLHLGLSRLLPPDCFKTQEPNIKFILDSSFQSHVGLRLWFKLNLFQS
jgi:hypothetical protein